MKGGHAKLKSRTLHVAGAYSGQLAARSYELVFHLRHSPKMVLFSCNESKGLPHMCMPL